LLSSIPKRFVQIEKSAHLCDFSIFLFLRVTAQVSFVLSSPDLPVKMGRRAVMFVSDTFMISK